MKLIDLARWCAGNKINVNKYSDRWCAGKKIKWYK